MSRASEYRRLRNGGKCRPEGDNFSVEERRKERYAELKISRKGPDYIVKRAALKGAMLGLGAVVALAVALDAQIGHGQGSLGGVHQGAVQLGDFHAADVMGLAVVGEFAQVVFLVVDILEGDLLAGLLGTGLTKLFMGFCAEARPASTAQMINSTRPTKRAGSTRLKGLKPFSATKS